MEPTTIVILIFSVAIIVFIIAAIMNPKDIEDGKTFSERKVNFGGCFSIFIALSLIAFLIYLFSPKSNTSFDENLKNQKNFQVKYSVEGTARAVSITLQNSQGGTEQGDYKLPFSENFTMQAGSFAYISAQNLGERGSVTVKIFIDEILWKEASSSGAYKIASTSGIVGAPY